MIPWLRLQVYRIVHRRKYRNILKPIPRERIRVIWSHTFEFPSVQRGNILTVKDNLEMLKLCTKSGSWVVRKTPTKRKIFWTSRPRQYFTKFPSLTESLTLNTQLLNKVNLLHIADCSVSRSQRAQTSLNMYVSRLSSKTIGKEIDSALLLDVSGGYSFQHFIQDTLPLLALLKQSHPVIADVPLILPICNSSFMGRSAYLDAMGVRNPIIEIDTIPSLHVKNLYIFDFKPLNALYGLPASVYYQTFKMFQRPKLDMSQKRSVLLVERNQQNRNFENITMVSDLLRSWAKSKELAFDTINTAQATFKETRDCFNRAAYIFAIHGGANYNIIWSQPDATLIEFIPVSATDSLIELALSFGMNYLPYAVNHDKGDPQFIIGDKELQNILQVL